MNGCSKRFTLIDLLVVACLCIFLVAALVPAAGILDDGESRIRCAANLKSIGAAFREYSENNNGKYPRTKWIYKSPEKLTAYSSWKTKDPFGADGPGPADLTAPMYLLLRACHLEPTVFVCPATDAKRLYFGTGPADITEFPAEISNFPSEENLSYSMNNPYPSTEALKTEWAWDVTLGDDFPLVADMNPGGDAVAAVTITSTAEELKKANSRNHGGAGQNVLYGDYHVTFQITPFCGPVDKNKAVDNIYTRALPATQKSQTKLGAGDDPIIGPSISSHDAVLLPTAGYKPAGLKK